MFNNLFAMFMLQPPALLESDRLALKLLKMSSSNSEVFFLSKNTQHNLDLRGTIIPLSLLKASQTFRMINPGEVLEVICNDPEVHKDLFKVLPAASYDLISVETLEDDQASYRLRLRKAIRKTPLWREN